MADGRQVSTHTVLPSLAAFAQPALEHSSIPEEMIAISVGLGDWIVVFFSSLPNPSAWMHGEGHSEPFEDTVVRVVEYVAEDPNGDVFIE